MKTFIEYVREQQLKLVKPSKKIKKTPIPKPNKPTDFVGSDKIQIVVMNPEGFF